MTTIHITPAVLEPAAAAQYVGLSTSTMEREERSGNFPRRVLLSGRRTGFRVRELQAWVDSRPAADLAPPKNCGVGRAGRAREGVAA
ncbi:MAG: AlpA family phage regulatory protein [Hydrogenophaga sp.]|nr:AlpA family phage regulatory protein [Hydrogenophaga sp.]